MPIHAVDGPHHQHPAPLALLVRAGEYVVQRLSNSSRAGVERIIYIDPSQDMLRLAQVRVRFCAGIVGMAECVVRR